VYGSYRTYNNIKEGYCITYVELLAYYFVSIMPIVNLRVLWEVIPVMFDGMFDFLDNPIVFGNKKKEDQE